MLQLRPSASSVWTKCHGYPQMMSRLPRQPSGDAAREGTCAAWLADMVLSGEVGTCADLIGEAHENGWVVDPIMARHIQGYVTRVRSHGGTVQPEQFVRLNEMIGGTPDATSTIITGMGNNTLIVDDLKYGMGIVEPNHNTQVSIYTQALINQARADGWTVTHVTIGIYQPRAYHPEGVYRTWSPSVAELAQFVDWIEAQGVACQEPNAVLAPGSHCKHCEAAHTCPSVAAANYDNYTSWSNQTQRDMTATELAAELDFIERFGDMLAGRKTAVNTEAMARINRGETIPGWAKARGTGDRRWTQDSAIVKLLTGVDPTDGRMVTPAEMERRGVSASVLDKLTETPKTKPKLKRFSASAVSKQFGG